MTQSHKLLFLGEPGAGKTTCIASLSDIPPLSTDVGCTDELATIKESTTVAFDYGEVHLGDQERLLLYGLPGQAHFQFMFEVVREGLLGVIILVDASSPLGMEGLRVTLQTYADEIRGLPCVVSINKHPSPPASLLKQCEQVLQDFGLVTPILTVDARKREDLVKMFDLLFILLEHGPGNLPKIEQSKWH